MKERIMNDLKEAMKSQNKEVLSVVRMLKGAIQMEEIKLKKELSDDEIVSVISRQIKSRRETIEELANTNREDLISNAKNEIEVLSKYMPEMMGEDEIKKVIDNIFEEVKPVDSKDIGKVMGKISPLLKGKADMGLVSKLIKDRLN